VSTAGALSGVTGITWAPGVANVMNLVSDGAADDLTISQSGATDSSIVVSTTGTGVDALQLTASAGGIDISGGVGGDIDILSTGKSVNITATETAADQVKVSATGTIAGNAVNIATTDGGIVLNAGGAANGDMTLTVGDAVAINATGTAAITSSDWGISTTGVVTKIASIEFDNSSVIYNTTVALSNAQIKALRAAPVSLVATPGADKFIELVSAVIIMNYGTNVLTESADDLVIQYITSDVDATATIEMTGFIDQAADQIAIVRPVTLATVPASSVVNNGLELFNAGDGEIAGNAGNDTTASVRISYRVHTAGL